MRQFFLTLAEGVALPAPGTTVALDEEESHHLETVLRGGRDTVLHLVDGRGHRLRGEPAGHEGRRALVRILEVSEDPLERGRPDLVLACAVVKGRRFEWALEKAVELGAHRILPLTCDHGVVTPRRGKQDRWLTIMKSAVKQCGRSWLPSLSEPCSVTGALTAIGTGDILFGAAPWETPTREVLPWNRLLESSPDPLPEALVFFVGPEGGWSPAELALLGAKGCPVSLGPHVLRAETAAAAGLTALQTLRQSWRDSARSS